MTETPATNTYTSVISQESVCIALTLAVLNDLELNLTAPVLEKRWCVFGPEFCADARKCAVVVSSLYGLKSAGTALCTK
jgi:hypothetical protein